MLRRASVADRARGPTQVVAIAFWASAMDFRPEMRDVARFTRAITVIHIPFEGNLLEIERYSLATSNIIGFYVIRLIQ
jgi:hypothetical protein